jgi:hypothetical protein
MTKIFKRAKLPPTVGTNIVGVRRVVDGFARVHEEPLFTMRVATHEVPQLLTIGSQISAGEDFDSPYKGQPKYKALVTDPARFPDKDGKNGIMVAAVGANYPLIQHATTKRADGTEIPGPFSMTLDRLEALGVDEVKMGYFESANKATVTMTWPDLFIVPADGEPIDMGFYMTHGFGDKSFGVGGVGERQVCINGMVMPALVGLFTIKHAGKVPAVISKIDKALQTIQVRADVVTEYINAAIKVEIPKDLEVVKALLETDAGYGKGFAENIALNYMSDPKAETLYDLYNHSTNFATYYSRTFFAKLDNSAAAESLLQLPSVKKILEQDAPQVLAAA